MSIKWTFVTIEEQEAYLKSNAKCTYDLSLIAMYVKHYKNDHACIWLNKLRARGLC